MSRITLIRVAIARKPELFATQNFQLQKSTLVESTYWCKWMYLYDGGYFAGERVGMLFPLLKSAGTHGNGVPITKTSSTLKFHFR